MTIKQIVALNKYYAKHPPVHIMIAAYLGIKQDDKPKEIVDNDFDAVMAELMKEGFNV